MSSHTNSSGKPGPYRGPGGGAGGAKPSMESIPIVGGPLDGGHLGLVEWEKQRCFVICGHFYAHLVGTNELAAIDPLRCPCCRNALVITATLNKRTCLNCSLLFDPITSIKELS